MTGETTVKIGVFCTAILLIALEPVQASAEPVTFVFEMPFFVDGSVDFVGQTSTLEITVDNGGSSTVNQTYFNTQITGLAVTVGAQFIALNVIDNVSMFEGFLPYITTDNLGTPTLDLSAFENSAAFLSNGEDFIQIGTAGDLGPTAYHVDIGESFGISSLVVSVPGIGPDVALAVPDRGSSSGSGALSLFGVGLLGLCVALRKTVLSRAFSDLVAVQAFLVRLDRPIPSSPMPNRVRVPDSGTRTASFSKIPA